MWQNETESVPLMTDAEKEAASPRGMKRRLLSVITALSIMAMVIVVGGLASSASAAPAGWYCYATNSQSCVSQFGYGGQSVWGYPVDAYGNNCTNYAASRLNQNGVANPGNLGNASTWAGNAAAKGISVDHTPAVGAIAQWVSANHVAYVDWVSPDGTQIAVSESGYGAAGGYPSMTGRSVINATGSNPSSNDPTWPSNFIHFQGSGTPVNGSFVSYQGNIYRMAGGAPTYVSTWTPFGGQQPTIALTDAQWNSLPTVPADSTFITGAQTGQVYRVAGGAPIYVASWAPFGGSQPTMSIDQAAIDNAGAGGIWNHLNSTPASGTFVIGSQSGNVYRIAGGAPIYVSTWSAFGGNQPVVYEDQAAIDNAGSGGIWKHLNFVPSSGTFITGAQSGQVLVVVGGAPIYVGSWATYGGPQSTVSIDQNAIENAGGPAPLNHMNFYPADGSLMNAVPSGNVFQVISGHPHYILDWSEVGGPQPSTTVSDDDIANAGAIDHTNPWSHLLEPFVDGAQPTISGQPEVGQTLTVNPSSWGPGNVDVGYQWNVDGNTVSGATGPTYTVPIADLGHRLTVSTTGSKPGYLPTSRTSAATTSVFAPIVAPPVVATRLSGGDRFSTSAAISAASFAPGVPVVYVANGFNFPDALSAAPVAGKDGAPVLLVSADTIPAAIQTELARLNPGRIVVLGGINAVSDAVKVTLQQYTVGTVTRLSGSDRFATSAAISAASFAPGVPVVYVANGFNFPDALSAAPVAGKDGAPVLLVSADAIPAVIQTELSRLKPGRIVVLGGVNAVSDAVKVTLQSDTMGTVSRLSGSDRFSTSAAISAAAFTPGVPVVYIANGFNFPDALSAAPVAGKDGAPVLLVSADSIPGAIQTELTRLKPGRIVVLGGVNAVSDTVSQQLIPYISK